jgi:CheY-like chemotaxis protein
VAHDFNNILTIIQGNLSLVIGGGLPKTSQDSALNHTFAAAERAAGLTRQLLTFGRRQPFQPTDIDLNQLVTNIARMLRRLIGEHISLETLYAEGSVCAYADPGMVEQVLINLAVNARDAMPQNGKLTLETRCFSFRVDEIDPKSSRRPGDYVCLSVCDTGQGIAPENLPHIFEPFFTTKEVGHGTGLGLATVFGIVEQHDGWIEVESQVDAGTAFHIFLPRSSKTVVPLEKNLDSAPIRGGNETILLVEDELPVREFMVNILTRHGYRVHEASSGVSACKVWQVHRDSIDLLITDMVMPEGIDGRQLADTLRAEKSSLKIIYCSGYTDEVLGNNSLLRDKVNFLDKPFEYHKFLNAVRHCLDGQ